MTLWWIGDVVLLVVIVPVVVEVVTSGRTELLELTNRMRALAGVVSTETFFYLEMWKQLYDWGTRA